MVSWAISSSVPTRPSLKSQTFSGHHFNDCTRHALRRGVNILSMKSLSTVLIVLGVAALALPAFINQDQNPLMEILPLLGILFLGVGLSVILTQKICSKK